MAHTRQLEECEHKFAQALENGDGLEALAHLQAILEMTCAAFGNDMVEADEARYRLVMHCNCEGKLAIDQGEMNAAEQFLKEAMKQVEAPGNVLPRSMKAVTYSNYGCFARSLGRPNAAITYLQKALALEVSSKDAQATTHLNLCTCHSELKRHDKAKLHAERALDLMRGRIDVFFGVDGEKLSEDVVESLRCDALPAAFFNLGVQKEFLGDARGALDAYEDALEIAEVFYGKDNGTYKMILQARAALKRDVRAPPLVTKAPSLKAPLPQQAMVRKRRALSARRRRPKTMAKATMEDLEEELGRAGQNYNVPRLKGPPSAAERIYGRPVLPRGAMTARPPSAPRGGPRAPRRPVSANSNRAPARAMRGFGERKSTTYDASKSWQHESYKAPPSGKENRGPPKEYLVDPWDHDYKKEGEGGELDPSPPPEPPKTSGRTKKIKTKRRRHRRRRVPEEEEDEDYKYDETVLDDASEGAENLEDDSPRRVDDYETTAAPIANGTVASPAISPARAQSPVASRGGWSSSRGSAERSAEDKPEWPMSTSKSNSGSGVGGGNSQSGGGGGRSGGGKSASPSFSRSRSKHSFTFSRSESRSRSRSRSRRGSRSRSRSRRGSRSRSRSRRGSRSRSRSRRGSRSRSRSPSASRSRSASSQRSGSLQKQSAGGSSDFSDF